MSFTVHIIRDAEKDLYEIYNYVRKSGFPINARKLFSTNAAYAQILIFQTIKSRN